MKGNSVGGFVGNPLLESAESQLVLYFRRKSVKMTSHRNIINA